MEFQIIVLPPFQADLILKIMSKSTQIINTIHWKSLFIITLPSFSMCAINHWALLFLSSKYITDVSTYFHLCLATLLVLESCTILPSIFQICHILSFLRAFSYTASSALLFFLHFAWLLPSNSPCPHLDVMTSRNLTTLSIRISYQLHVGHSSDFMLSSHIHLLKISLNFSFHKGKIFLLFTRVCVTPRSTDILQIINNGW